MKETPDNIQKQKYHTETITIAAAGTYSGNFETDIDWPRTTGVAIVVSDRTKLNGGKLGLKINNKEIFPNDYPAELIFVGDDVSSEDKYFTLDEPAGGVTVKYEFETTSDTFEVKLVFRLEYVSPIQRANDYLKKLIKNLFKVGKNSGEGEE